MPTRQPSISFQSLRNYMEKFTWRDKRTGLMTTGYNPPAGAQDLARVPFHVRFVTGKGRREEGNAICLKVDRRKHLRMIQFVESGAIRYLYDFLVIEVDGTRVLSH